MSSQPEDIAELEAASTAEGGSESLHPEEPPTEETVENAPAEEELVVEAVEENQDATVASVIEAVLFASDEPVSPTKLASIVEITSKQLKEAIQELNERYRDAGHAFRIEKIAGGLQMLTLPMYQSWLRKLVKVRSDNKLSPAALETLAIVAYKQPVIRADIEAIRGVASGEILRSLMYKGLAKVAGRAEIVGRPMQYGTTKKFLEVFGLNSLKDLPSIEELKQPVQSAEADGPVKDTTPAPAAAAPDETSASAELETSTEPEDS